MHSQVPRDMLAAVFMTGGMLIVLDLVKSGHNSWAIALMVTTVLFSLAILGRKG